MKKIPASLRQRRLASFTLIELLVVLAIILILAGTILFAGNIAIKAAKKAKAASMAAQLQTATLAYYTEYSVYPVGPSTADNVAPAIIQDTLASQTAWGNLIDALSGNFKPSTGAVATQTSVTNSRGIVFITLKTSDVDSQDAPLNPLPTGAEIYFNIAMDADYNGLIGAQPTNPNQVNLPNFATGTATTLSLTGGNSTAGVAVWANCNGSATVNNANGWVHTY